MRHSGVLLFFLLVIAVLVGCGGGGGDGDPVADPFAGSGGGGSGGGGGSTEPPAPDPVEPAPFALMIDGSNNSYGHVLFDDGSIVVAGDCGDEVLLESADGAHRSETVEGDGAYLARYNAAGEIAWVRTFPGTGEFRFRNLIKMPDGGLVGYCYSYGLLTLDGFVVEDDADDAKTFFLVWFDPEDGSIDALKRVWSGTKGRVGYAAAALDGSIFVTSGYYSNPSRLDPDSGTPVDLAPLPDPAWSIFLAKFDPEGSLAWHRAWEGVRNLVGTDAITALRNGDVVVGMTFIDEMTFSAGRPDETTLTSDSGDYHGALLRYSAHGALLWAKDMGGEIEAKQIVEVEDGIVATGYFSGSVRFALGTSNEIGLTSAGFIDGFLARYESNGSLRWVRHTSGPDRAASNALARTADGGFVVTGWMQETTTFNAGASDSMPVSSTGLTDPFLARYDSAGGLQWVRSFTNPSWGAGYGVSVQANGRIFVTGSFDDELTFPGATSPDLIASTTSSLFVAQFDANGNLPR